MARGSQVREKPLSNVRNGAANAHPSAPQSYGLSLTGKVEDETGNTKLQGRKRIAVACGRCRKRKIRCSGDTGDGQGCLACQASTDSAGNCQFLRVSSQEVQSMFTPCDVTTASADSRVTQSVTPCIDNGLMANAPVSVASELSGSRSDALQYPFGQLHFESPHYMPNFGNFEPTQYDDGSNNFYSQPGGLLDHPSVGPDFPGIQPSVVQTTEESSYHPDEAVLSIETDHSQVPSFAASSTLGLDYPYSQPYRGLPEQRSRRLDTFAAGHPIHTQSQPGAVSADTLGGMTFMPVSTNFPNPPSTMNAAPPLLGTAPSRAQVMQTSCTPPNLKVEDSVQDGSARTSIASHKRRALRPTGDANPRDWRASLESHHGVKNESCSWGNKFSACAHPHQNDLMIGCQQGF